MKQLLFVITLVCTPIALSADSQEEPDSTVPTFREQIDSYKKAQQFSGFLSANEGSAVRILITAVRPFWDKKGCAFMLRMTGPDDAALASAVYGDGEQYCIEDCRGGYDSENPSGVFQLTIKEDTLVFEGEFVPTGNMGHGHQGIYSAGLSPVHTNSKVLMGTPLECH